jgi:hypothetical protein
MTGSHPFGILPTQLIYRETAAVTASDIRGIDHSRLQAALSK